MARNRDALHVVPGFDGGWTVKGKYSVRATKRFGTKEEALAWAIKDARRKESEVVIHGRDGRISSKDSYGRDPHPPRGPALSRGHRGKESTSKQTKGNSPSRGRRY